MNIVLLTSDYLPNVGGMATHAHELARAHARNGHTVHLVHPVFGAEPDRVEDGGGFRVHKLFIDRTVPRIKHLYYIAAVRTYLIRLIAADGIDVVHWHDLTPNCWTTRTIRGRVPLVWTNHTSNFLEMVETAFGRRKIRLFLHHPDAIISPSSELHRKSAFTGVRGDRLYFIPNGVDTGTFAPGNSFDVIDKDFGIDPSRPVIICPRRLEPKNGVEYLIRSVPLVRAAHPDAQFLIVGGGFPDERARFEAFLTESGQRHGVFFTGNVPNSSMPKFYALATISVLPSIMEATSISGLESMASGLPLVGTNVGGIPEIIEDGVSGILVEPRSPEELARACVRLLGDEALRRGLGANARARVEREFSWTGISRRTVEIYETVVADRTARTRRGR